MGPKACRVKQGPEIRAKAIFRLPGLIQISAPARQRRNHGRGCPAAPGDTGHWLAAFPVAVW